MTRYYRNVITVEILSREPWTADEMQDLRVVADEIDCGGSSGQITVTVHNEEVSTERMAELLTAQGSDPGFLINDEEN